MHRSLLLTVVIAALSASGCSDGPARSFEKFYDALAAGEPEAIERLSTRARAQLDDDARRDLLATPPRAAVKSVRVISESDVGGDVGDVGDVGGGGAKRGGAKGGKTATLEVVDVLGDKDEVRMIFEDGAWRVDL